MDINDQNGLNRNIHRFENLKDLLSKSRNNKKELNKIFLSEQGNLFYTAVKSSDSLAAYLIQFAIKNGVDSTLLLGTVNGKNPLQAAVRSGNYELVEMILKYATDHGRRKAALLAPGRSGKTAFQIAVSVQDIESMKAIFRFGVDNGVSAGKLLGLKKKGQTVLHRAVEQKTRCDVLRAIVTLAIDNGVNAALLFKEDHKGRTPLHLAANRKFRLVDSVIALAEECGICAKSLIGPDQSGNSPLHYAFKANNADSVEAILNYITDSNEEPSSHFTAMNHLRDTFHTMMSWTVNKGVHILSVLRGDSLKEKIFHNQIICEPWIWPLLYPSQSR
jgi:Ankyrin repeats (3 copies)